MVALLLSIILFLCPFFGCTGYYDSDTRRIEYRTGIETIVTVYPPEVFAGEEVEIKIIVINHDAFPVLLRFPSNCVFHHVMITPEGKTLGKRRMCATVMTNLRLEPGKPKFETFRIDTRDLEPGFYRVQGGVTHHKDRCPWSETLLKIIY